jgi:homoserine dehydrogenase
VARPTIPPAPPLRIALLGLGTVGREVAVTLLRPPDELREIAGRRELRLVAVGVREPARSRGVDLPGTVRRTDDLGAVATDPDVDVVVELLGGLEPAGTLIRDALRSGRSVVTANKALLACHGEELEQHARGCGRPLRFEAAVGGGIPVLGPLASDLAANRITGVYGIVNGTTNYILDRIREVSARYEEVLAEAQALGYAEADPRGDVEGNDAVHKLVILVRLAFGGWLRPDTVLRCLPQVRGDGRPGITSIRHEDLDAAAALDWTTKLVAFARRGPELGTVFASVAPMLVPRQSALGETGGVRNRIEIEAEPVGVVGFDGPGAGGRATSSAVVSDILAIAHGKGSTWGLLPPPVPLALAGEGLAGAALDEPRTWFAYLPGVTEAKVPRSLATSAVGGPDGTALLSRPIRVERLRELLCEVLPPGIDSTLYPLLEAA